ncbi:succinylglutamate desuccinylase/aspartoacylase family protein [Ferrimonas balearica]|uniref:succinylglutamate desuccinylase/aspartoacylase family protein n=1 Tax=Ferrimonas balearica TaxID=44012 RepID=UPI001C9922FE|nr:succinylglutamate desuccinylase/aspartoacylase family protein [Ferrimonas balearica]MBY5993644.1 succinylglutamate desuccinylase/aspartoacylase family protein [Ferrimonas balearica]
MAFNTAPLIDRLDLTTLASGRHAFRFGALQMATGQDWQIPVLVFKGARPGPRVVITAGTHGDELNGVLAAQQLGRELDAEALSGTLVLLPGVNLPGMLERHRDFVPSDPDCSTANLNRLFPGKADGDSAQRYLHRIWNGLLAGNADYALDLHTQTRGASYPLFVFADFRNPTALAMARWLGADCIQDDPGDPGVLETVWNQLGVPCVTLEVGSGSAMAPELIQRAVSGIHRVLAQLKVGPAVPEVALPVPFEGNATATVRAQYGGLAIPQVRLGEAVAEGDLVAVQYDPFGAERQRYHAPVAGRVLSLNDDPLREPGSLLVRLLYRR